MDQRTCVLWGTSYNYFLQKLADMRTWITDGHFDTTFNKNNWSVRSSTLSWVYTARRRCSVPQHNSKFRCHWTVPEMCLLITPSLLKMGNTSHSTANVTAWAVKAWGLTVHPLLSSLSCKTRGKTGKKLQANTAQITCLFKNTHANTPGQINLRLLKKTHLGWPTGTVFPQQTR